MKIVEYSMHARPIIHSAKSYKAAKRIARQCRERQTLAEIYTEKEYKNEQASTN